MRHLGLLFSLFVLSLLLSCNKDKKEEQYTLSDSEKEKIESIVENTLRTELFSHTGRPASDVKIENSFLQNIDGKPYLVSMYGEYRTNSLLEENSKTMEYVYGGISCTSKRCATTRGCVPSDDKLSCTECMSGLGDCTKTVTDKIIGGPREE
ncbi:hypothetical protein EII28_11860 [Fusobacterium nucleatum]|uniref:Lipoprotein n=3 Tax=Bacteria TaxID=2 RepID=A0A3P1VJW0_FUSNU|nr:MULTISPECIES: hypothetical protein [Bacteria]RRC96894.1 hypothetical protein EII32_10950 [Prevotella sp. OH937_COT-195]RRD34559.1 hypothetical protein EII28_11860 [Fusobacterium nucleatum]RRD69095.1 hypothetical protein EII24_11440 [Desulfovibrio sp. OH1209_COT-279]RRD85091.1 hypothetical protein EII23_11440 [Desulfovibrio sp. OH1186_COT-070]